MEKEHGVKSNASQTHPVLPVFIIFCFIGIMPIIVVWSFSPVQPAVLPDSAPGYIVNATGSAGLSICSGVVITPDVRGSSYAVLYTLSSDCSQVSVGNPVYLLEAEYSDSTGINGAVSLAEAESRRWQAMDVQVFSYGNNLIAVKGSGGDPSQETIGQALVAEGARQIV